VSRDIHQCSTCGGQVIWEDCHGRRPTCDAARALARAAITDETHRAIATLASALEVIAETMAGKSERASEANWWRSIERELQAVARRFGT
jgi:hypothetical protein